MESLHCLSIYTLINNLFQLNNNKSNNNKKNKGGYIKKWAIFVLFFYCWSERDVIPAIKRCSVVMGSFHSP
jgi:hypothetical protein